MSLNKRNFLDFYLKQKPTCISLDLNLPTNSFVLKMARNFTQIYLQIFMPTQAELHFHNFYDYVVDFLVQELSL